ncbi:MAG: hypothetical protein HY706_02850 [Candidatus Hydrogenedentes bacterium]|nr:hypothetical protein [Candidatus Hydrogenedentota bacterium]
MRISNQLAQPWRDSVELFPPVTDSPHWENSYDGFTTPGTYQIAVYAKDRIGNTSLPKLTTVSVINPLRRKAVLVAGILLAGDDPIIGGVVGEQTFPRSGRTPSPQRVPSSGSGRSSRRRDSQPGRRQKPSLNCRPWC